MKTLQRQVAGKTVLEWICYIAAQIKEVNGNWSREGGDLTVTAHSGDVVTLVRAGRRFMAGGSRTRKTPAESAPPQPVRSCPFAATGASFGPGRGFGRDGAGGETGQRTDTSRPSR